MSLSPITQCSRPRERHTAAVDRAAVLENQHHNARSAAAFDQSPKGFIELCIARLGRKSQRNWGGIERERYHSRLAVRLQDDVRS